MKKEAVRLKKHYIQNGILILILFLLSQFFVECKNKSDKIATITPTSNIEEVELVNIPKELLPYASFLHKADLELYCKEDMIKKKIT